MGTWALIVVLLSGDSYILDSGLSFEDCRNKAIALAPLDAGCMLEARQPQEWPSESFEDLSYKL